MIWASIRLEPVQILKPGQELQASVTAVELLVRATLTLARALLEFIPNRAIAWICDRYRITCLGLIQPLAVTFTPPGY